MSFENKTGTTVQTDSDQPGHQTKAENTKSMQNTLTQIIQIDATEDRNNAQQKQNCKKSSYS